MTEMDYLYKFNKILSSIDYYDPREFIGCNEQEILLLENHINSPNVLPEAFRSFLEFGGHKIGDLRPADCFYYEDILATIQDPEGLHVRLEEDADFSDHFPPQGIVFYEHFGSELMYIRVDEGPNPRVYYWSEDGANHYNVRFKRYSDCLEELAKEHVDFFHNMTRDKLSLVKRVKLLKEKLLDLIDVISFLQISTSNADSKRFNYLYNAFTRILSQSKEFLYNGKEETLSAMYAVLEDNEILQSVGLKNDKVDELKTRIKEARSLLDDI